MALNKYWFALVPYGRAVANNNAIDGKTSLFFNSSVDTKLAADTHAREHFGLRGGASSHTHFDHLTLYGGRDYREWIVSLPDYQRVFSARTSMTIIYWPIFGQPHAPIKWSEKYYLLKKRKVIGISQANVTAMTPVLGAEWPTPHLNKNRQCWQQNLC